MAKYINQLTEADLSQLFRLFCDDETDFCDMIERDEKSILIAGVKKGEFIVSRDGFRITDYRIYKCDWCGRREEEPSQGREYRKWMFDKFGPQYAEDYLLR